MNSFPTLKKFIRTALLPVGHTMYVYGGGWNEEDTFAGTQARTIGESAAWQQFFETQCSNYDFKRFLHCSSLGLDCTGYIGWAVYNLFNDTDNQEGYVFESHELGYRLSELGLGSVTEAHDVTDHRFGDIFFSEKHRHAYISIGECSDKSVLLLHSSPPGVMLSGTSTPEGCASVAQKCATDFMRRKYPLWFSKFPDSNRGADYLSDYHRFRFFNVIVSDPEGYAFCSPLYLTRYDKLS